MSWIQKLYDTYEACQPVIGKDIKNPLLPICHILQKVQIEITIDNEGNFIKAEPIYNENEAKTIIPCTENSASRTNSPAPHALCDKLQYVAADYKEFGGEKKSYYSDYLKLLESWCKSEFKHPKAVAVFEYIKKCRIIADLVDSKVFYAKDGKLMKKWEGEKKDKPKLFTIFQNQTWQAESFIRWIIIKPGELQTKTWTDESLWKSWIDYYSNLRNEKGFCYVKGTSLLLTDLHSRYIRKEGDGAKLISSNDTSGYTFRGRFLNADQASGVSLEVSQKAHLALQWLIRRQGKIFYVKGDNGKFEPALTIVAWSISENQTPDLIMVDTSGIIGEDDLPSDEASLAYTAQDFALKLNKKISGYSQNLRDTKGVVVMGLDSATPGRMAITFYRELTSSEFLDRVENWHKTCSWIHDYGVKEIDKDGKMEKSYYRFVGAPSPDDIALAAYGRHLDDKLRKSTVEKLLPCIIDGQKLPKGLVESAISRASNRVGMKNWEWNKTLSIACALYRKYYENENYNGKEGFDMALEENRRTRDYLYGRLLALADRLEEYALSKSGEKRATNAARYMQQFANRPNKTWQQIETALSPYLARLGGRAIWYKDLVDEVMGKFDSVESFTLDKPLTGEFLLGYHCQREKLKPSKKEENQDDFSEKQES